jgi:hypothetical protein
MNVHNMKIVPATPATASDVPAHSRRARPRTDTSIATLRHLPLDARADLAARWVMGLTTIRPSTVLARHVFRVSIDKIKHAMRGLNAGSAESALEQAWGNATSDDRASFVRDHASSLFRLIDTITAP